MKQQHPDPDWRDYDPYEDFGKADPDPGPYDWVWALALLLAAGVIAWVVVFASHTAYVGQAHAEDMSFFKPHRGLDPNDPVVQWFEKLERPWCPPQVDHCLCCGQFDAYPVVIDQEATPDGEEDDGIAHVTDPSAKEFPSGPPRDELVGDLTFHFKGKDVVKTQAGNPTGTAWAFLGNYKGHITLVWCVVYLPPNS